MSNSEYLIVGTDKRTWTTSDTAIDETTRRMLANRMRTSVGQAELTYLTGFAPPTLLLPTPPQPRQCSVCVGQGRVRGRTCHGCRGKGYKGG